MIDIKYEIKLLSRYINEELENAWRDSLGEPYRVDNESIIKNCITTWVQDMMHDGLEELKNE